MKIPKEIEMLYHYIENNGLYVDAHGYRYGYLYPEDKMIESWTDDERDGGTNITFIAGGTENLKYWFGENNYDEKLEKRLCVFAQSGREGSECAFWLTDENKLKIVDMGSGSTLVCVLADIKINPNKEFQNWVKDTFHVEIPKTALEIVKYPAKMDDVSSNDEFFNWLEQYRS